jgi:tetratricopeptide (TPR) repeat protein
MSAQAHLDRADALFEEGRIHSAMAEAKAALRADPGNAEARSLIEDLEVEIGAETALKRARGALARGDREAARREVLEGLRLKPQDGRLTAILRQLNP